MSNTDTIDWFRNTAPYINTHRGTTVVVGLRAGAVAPSARRVTSRRAEETRRRLRRARGHERKGSNESDGAMCAAVVSFRFVVRRGLE